MKEPTYIGCGREHSYCKTCVDDCYNRGIDKCPKCSQKLKKDDIELDDDLYGEILILEINCPKCKKWKGRLANHKKHLKTECGKQESGLGSVISGFGNLAFGNANNGFQIFVRTLEGRDIVFNKVQGTDTVSSLQRKIEDKEGIPVNQQR